MRTGAVMFLGLLAACRGEPASPAARSTAAPGIGSGAGSLAGITAPPAGPDDAVVARVDGRPVYASCVAAQAGGSIRAALDECIAFELLAGEAAARGLGALPAVTDAVRQAMVSRLVELEFEDKVRTAADLPPAMVETAVERRGLVLQQPLRRTGVYVRATLPKTTPAGAPEDVAARRLVEAIHAELAGRRDLFPDDIFETGERIAAARGGKVDFDRNPYSTPIDQRADPAWRAALFAIPAIGMISPPVRTSFGWEIILWVDTLPATNPTREDLLATLFPDLRRAYFPYWTNRFARTMRVERDPDWQKTLSSLEGP